MTVLIMGVFVVIPYKAIPFAMKKLPYKSGGLSWWR